MCRDHDHGSGPWEYIPSPLELLVAVGPYLLGCISGISALFIVLWNIFGTIGLQYASAIVFGPFTICLVRMLLLDPPPSRTKLAKKHCRIAEERERIMGKQDEIADHLAQALRFKTTTFQMDGLSPEKAKKLLSEKAGGLTDMQAFFRRTYPVLHEKFQPILINKHTLMFEIKGSDPSLKPWLMYVKIICSCPLREICCNADSD